jgi:Alpha/beta hydrolase domain
LRGFYFRRLNTSKGGLTFDGALIVGAPGACWYLDRPGPSGCDGELSDGGKVIAVNPETDAGWNGFNARGGTADYRAIEVSGVSHIPVTAVDFRGVGVPRQNPVDALPVFRAALTNLQRWLRGTDPPPSVYITLREGPVGNLEGLPLKEAVRDADGNALGGVRLPHLPTALEDGKTAGAPLGTYNGLDLDFRDGNRYFLRSGLFVPFSEDRLRALYPNHDTYVSAVSLAARDLVVKRYIRHQGRRGRAPGEEPTTPPTGSRWKPLKRPTVQGRVGLFQPIDRDVSAVDPMSARRRQESDDIGHLLGGAEAAHRKTVADIVIKIFLVGEAVAIPAIARDEN